MKLADVITHLTSIPVSKWCVHEKVLCRQLGLKGTDSISARKQLSDIITALKKGYKGNKRLPTCEWTTHPCMDLGDTGTSNPLNIHFYFHGDKELFPTETLNSSSLIYYQPRYFSIGPDTVPVATQL